MPTKATAAIKPRSPVRLPQERVDQLRIFAETLNGRGTLSQAIGELMRMAAEQGRVPHGLPGVKVNRLSDGIAIQIADNEPQGFTFQDAQSIIDQVRTCCDTSQKATRMIVMGGDHKGTAEIHRQGGTAVMVAIPFDAAPRNYPMDIAADFADVIERALKAK